MAYITVTIKHYIGELYSANNMDILFDKPHNSLSIPWKNIIIRLYNLIFFLADLNLKCGGDTVSLANWWTYRGLLCLNVFFISTGC